MCPVCGTKSPAGASVCPKCNTPIGDRAIDPDETAFLSAAGAAEAETVLMDEAQTAKMAGESGWTRASRGADDTGTSTVELTPGAVLGSRYEITRALGEGAMGAVYQARDREVDRFVALKVIRPELAGDPEILRRFRQELVLARQVTHPNVVRIFDLGVIRGLRFISMEYIEGRQLSAVLEEEGKLEAKKAAEILLQVCRGLAAAHAEGIVHRDLKPSNIMAEKDGRIVVMDFGIARGGAASDMGAFTTQTGLAATQVGTLIGTPVYMSPEQAKAQPVDARSDLFTIGIIAYELLTGNLPFLAKTRRESLRKRCEEPPVPPVVLNPAIPKALNNLVLKSLQVKPEERYQNAGEVIRDLEIFLGLARPSARWKWLAGSVAASLLISGGIIGFNQRAARRAAPHPTVKILISDLQNNTGDPVLNGTIEPMLSVAMEGAPFITAFDRGQAHQDGLKLRPDASRLDASLARLVAIREGVDVVISGAIELAGGKYHLSVQAVDSTKGTSIKSTEVTASDKTQVPRSVAVLAASLRTALGDATPESAKLAAGETFSSDSLPAAQKYAQAQDLLWRGKWDESLRLYEDAVKLDPNFGRAYAGLATLLANEGRRQEAQKYYEIALTKLDRMSDREKYRTRSAYFLFMRKDQEALEQAKELVKLYPADTAGIGNLAFAYFNLRDMKSALAEGRRAVAIYPNDVPRLNNVGLFAMYAGDFATAIRESQKLLKINPQFGKALLCIGLSELGAGDADEAQKTWGRLQAMGKEGASMAAMGMADLELYQGRYREVVRTLPAAIAGDIQDKDVSEAALKRLLLADAYLATGGKAKALAAVETATGERSDEMVSFPAAEILIETGNEAKASALASHLRSRFDPEPRAYAALIDALVLLQHKNDAAAVGVLQEAQKISDTWLGRLELGRAYLEAGAFTEAETELDNCLNRRGEASAVFQDDEPSLHYLPAAYYYRGRAREGLHRPSAADDYKAFLAMKVQSEADPLVTDARRRLGRLP